MQGINFTRGFLRLWLVATVLWLTFMGFFIWEAASDETRGRYQYVEEIRDGINPWEAFDGKRPYTEVFLKPSETKQPLAFQKVEAEYQGAFEKAAAAGNIKLANLPDGFSLYLTTALEKSEHDILVNGFWDSRWRRQLSAVWKQYALAGFAIAPPFFLLALWFVGRWVVAGFRMA